MNIGVATTYMYGNKFKYSIHLVLPIPFYSNGKFQGVLIAQ